MLITYLFATNILKDVRTLQVTDFTSFVGVSLFLK